MYSEERSASHKDVLQVRIALIRRGEALSKPRSLNSINNFHFHPWSHNSHRIKL
jgi:hypothetical protein